MKYLLNILMFSQIMLVSCKAQQTQMAEVDSNFKSGDMMIRIAEIEIYPEYLKEYIAILKEESEASVRLEDGVVCIYPMFQKENPNQIRLLEIYADTNAYKAHLQTPHFKNYKTTTLSMVKSIELVEMQAIDPNSMNKIFKKLEDN